MRRVRAGGGQRRGGAGGSQIDGDPAGRPRHPPGLGQIALPEPAGPQDAGFDDPAFGAGEIAVVVHSTTSGGVRRRRLPSRGRTISASPTTMIVATSGLEKKIDSDPSDRIIDW